LVLFTMAVGVAMASAASAEMRVLDSDAAEVKTGSVWPDDAKLPIPPGKKVRMLLLPSNVTKVINGPSAEKAVGTAPWGATRQPNSDGSP
jgi:hypothetical protein